MIPERPPEAGIWQKELCDAVSRVSFVTLYAQISAFSWDSIAQEHWKTENYCDRRRRCS